MVKKDFPLFAQQTQLVYFDNAATTQRPQKVLDAMNNYYTHYNANVGRGIYGIAEQATHAVDNTRKQIANFIGASVPQEIIFTRGTTDSINIVAQSWAEHTIKAGDEIVVTQLEHHANFIPWQQLAQRKNAVLKIIPIDTQGQLQLDTLDKYITSQTKLVAVTHSSNALGGTIPITKIIAAAHKVGAHVLVDGAQTVGYESINVKELGCDFFVFSGHKMMGPTGIGVLYVKNEVYKEMKPASFGGGAVFQVSQKETVFLEPPLCYEPGTKAIAEIIGFGAAVEYLQSFGMQKISEHTTQLTNLLLDELSRLKKVTILGNQDALRKKGHVVSFVVDGMHPHDVAAFLDAKGICVRAGHHCAQPTFTALSYDASVRVSFNVYNDAQEISYFITCLKELL